MPQGIAMIRINDFKVKVDTDFDTLKKKCAKILKINPDEILTLSIDKRSIDARKKPDIYYVLRLIVEVKDENKVLHNKAVLKDGNVSAFIEKRYEFKRVISGSSLKDLDLFLKAVEADVYRDKSD